VTDESARLAALRQYRILDTEPEAAFDDLTLIASQICATPIALIALLDKDRLWFKSHVGTSTSETARSHSFCAQAVHAPGAIMQVRDAQADPRFRDNPMVTGEPRIRFYAGAPLVTPDGHALGTLCVLDRVPRTLTEAQAGALDALRRQVEAQLALRRNLAELQEALSARDAAEARQDALVHELRESLDHVNKLSTLMPYCSTCEFNAVMPAVPASIHKVSSAVRHLLEKRSWPEAEVMKVELALEEALANAIRHGCKNDPTKNVQCSVSCDADGELVIVIRDPGPGFDATKVPNPLEGDNLLKPGGRGVFLINELMDEVAFADGGREVQMRKRPAAPAPDDAPS